LYKKLKLSNQLMWRGLSGSDDLAWVGILCLSLLKKTNNKDFLTYSSRVSGVRTAINLYDEIEAVWKDKEEGCKIYWDK
jgi:hypothetical protein